MTKEQTKRASKKTTSQENREVGQPLPLKLPTDAGKIIQIAYAPNATPDWQDALVLTDAGKVFHGWYRIGAGWQGPEQVF